jgi:hypothetical protein
MAEWSNAAVLKTVVLQGTGGSNPSLSANFKFDCFWGSLHTRLFNNYLTKRHLHFS